MPEYSDRDTYCEHNSKLKVFYFFLYKQKLEHKGKEIRYDVCPLPCRVKTVRNKQPKTAPKLLLSFPENYRLIIRNISEILGFKENNTNLYYEIFGLFKPK